MADPDLCLALFAIVAECKSFSGSTFASKTDEQFAHPVETYKNSLTNSKDIRSSVDWLTEAIRRLSIAYLAKKDIRTVNMKSPFRPDKVCIQSIICKAVDELLCSGRKLLS